MADMFYQKSLSAGQPLKPYMVCGVLAKDYPGERNDRAVQAYFEEEFAKAIAEFTGKTYREFDTIQLGCMESRWELYTSPAPKYSTGKYFVMEKISILPIYTELFSPCDQTVTLKLDEARCAVILNGEVVYNNTEYYTRKRDRVYVFEHNTTPYSEYVELPLKKGRNVFLSLSGKVNRTAGGTFYALVEKCPEPITACVPLSSPVEVREEIYHSQLETYLSDDCYELGEIPQLHVGRMPLRYCRAKAVLTDDAGKQTQLDVDSETVAICQAAAPGNYLVTVRWELPDGSFVADSTYECTVVETIPAMPGFDAFQQRRQLSLELLAKKGDALALYRLGRQDEIDLDQIDRLCTKIIRREDCADFHLLPLLWLAWEDREAQLLDPRIHELIKRAALSFRYWVDEPGSSSMFYCSENHRIGFHVCEYLAGLLYPSDIFTNCGQNGMYHSLKGRMHLVEWLDQRCRMGFDEPHSDNYLPVTLSAILVLREVLPMEEYPLRNMVNVLLDFLTYIFAVSSFDGVMATPRGRSYTKPLRSGLVSSTSGIFWMMFGNYKTSTALISPEFAFSFYVPPRGLCELADHFEPATFHFKQGLMHFDKHNADFTIRRTNDYMIGGVRDHNVGMNDMHFVSAMAALRNDVSIFFSAPNNSGEGSGQRPDYWAGQAFLPRVLTGRRTLALIWHNVNDAQIWMTHCHFNVRKLDEVAVKDGWTFGRSGNGYVAIWSSVPHQLSTQGVYAGRELVAYGNETVWLCECGSQAEDGSFQQFIDTMTHAQIRTDGSGVHFASPGSGLMEFGLDEGFTVDGEDVPIPEYTAKSPYLTSRFGSGRFEYTCPGFRITQWTYPACQ